MGLPKIIWEPKKESNLHEKKIVESLITRLNDQIQKDQNKAKKAALIIEQWLKQTKP
jgi:hypothetical protein